MFTGFNSNVERDGEVYHVQTEDMGLGHPVVETRVYCGGQVVAAVRNSYADLADSPDYTEERIMRRMRDQHQALIQGLETGPLEDLETRVRTPIELPDADGLVHEYVEDWIDSSVWTAGIVRTLEREVDAHEAEQSARKSKKKTSSPA